MVEYGKVNVKLTDTQLKKTPKNCCQKQNTNYFKNEFQNAHELLLTARQKKKLRNTFSDNISTDLKLSKAQISKTLQSGGILGSLLSKLAGPLMKVAISLAKMF